MATAEKAAERAQKSFKNKDLRSAPRLLRQAAQKYTTASHSCDGEEKAAAQKAAATFTKLAEETKDWKLLEQYGKALQKFNKYHAAGSKLVQQEKWKEAAKKFDSAASTLKKYTRSRNPDIQASAEANVESTKVAAERCRIKAKNN